MSEPERKPSAVRSNQHPPSVSPAIVQSVDGEEWAVDHVEKRQYVLRLVNYETTDCEEVSEVVDLPYQQVAGIQWYPLAEHQTEALDKVKERSPLADGGTDDLEERVTELERKVELIADHNRRDTAPEGRR